MDRSDSPRRRASASTASTSAEPPGSRFVRPDTTTVNSPRGSSSASATCLGIPVTICVPLGNNPEKNEGIRALGARLVQEGKDYDESLAVSERIVRDEGAYLAHSTNNPHILAGAGTLSLEIVEQEPSLDALVIAVGGGREVQVPNSSVRQKGERLFELDADAIIEHRFMSPGDPGPSLPQGDPIEIPAAFLARV